MVKRGKGFSLIEVMVSLVILVIGLIGIFNLHVVSKRGSFESFQQTQASYYANDIINRMRLNPSQLTSYENMYAGAPTGTVPKACSGSAVCSPSEMKSWDVYEWQTLFSGSAEVAGGNNVGGLDTPTACISVATNTVTVVMVWRGIRKTTIDAANVDTSCASDKENRRVFSIKTVII
ncbi:type IV pilus modification protein PilV [Shewanella marisflavi]|uniref:Type IV pilus modification protein PilV n=1 Tax=Shewanella marisflavi TaxID=260364 RepID=A0AAC9U1R4_9GAMM|nr:type IV pilus modification protein PilV [Shewanella marisflavi]ASJ97577.1 type IV pilus modification protein PilV [Shewanella marisflavi]